jgi:hypothetical protein
MSKTKGDAHGARKNLLFSCHRCHYLLFLTNFFVKRHMLGELREMVMFRRCKASVKTKFCEISKIFAFFRSLKKAFVQL